MILLRLFALHMRRCFRFTWRSFAATAQAMVLATALVVPVADPHSVLGSVLLALWSLVAVAAVGALLGYRRVRQIRKAKGWA